MKLSEKPRHYTYYHGTTKGVPNSTTPGGRYSHRRRTQTGQHIKRTIARTGNLLQAAKSLLVRPTLAQIRQVLGTKGRATAK